MFHWIVAGLPWVLSAITIWMTVLAGNKHRAAWLIGLLNQALWLVWIVASASWGLLPMNLALWILYGRNHLKWAGWTEWRGSFDGRPSLLIRRLVSLFGCVVQVHKFVRADDAGAFHTHPAWAVRLILWGGYREEMADGSFREWRPGMIGVVRPDFEHRIDVLRNGRASWSLWFRGPKVAPIRLRGYQPAA